MNANLWTQLLIAIVPALITGVGSLIIALKKCKNEIEIKNLFHFKSCASNFVR